MLDSATGWKSNPLASHLATPLRSQPPYGGLLVSASTPGARAPQGSLPAKSRLDRLPAQGSSVRRTPRSPSLATTSLLNSLWSTAHHAPLDAWRATLNFTDVA
jgi:hypothetical protein